MKVIIADDEPLALDLLRSYLGDMPGVEVVGEAGDGGQLVELVRTCATDLVICDIEMPGVSGLQVAQAITAAPAGARPGVIFTTAHSRHALAAFEVGATDYVMKPLNRLRLRQAMVRALGQVMAARSAGALRDEGCIWVPSRSGKVRVAISDISRVEAAGDHVYLHTAARTYLHRSTMKAMAEVLAPTGLIRVRRSTFVRLRDVQGVTRAGKAVLLQMVDGAEIQVGASYKDVLASLDLGMKEARDGSQT